MSTIASTCVLLADKHTRFIDGVRGLLQTQFDAVYLVADVHSLTQGTRRLQPTALVVDLSISTDDFTGLLSDLKKASPASALIALTVLQHSPVAALLLDAGADGVVLKRSVGEDLLDAIDAAAHGLKFISPGFAPSAGTISDSSPAEDAEGGR